MRSNLRIDWGRHLADQAAARAEADKAIEATGQAERERYQAAVLAAEQDEKYPAALAAYDVTYTRAEDTCVAAHENPAPDVRRETAGYSRAVVLKMAMAEHQLCPECSESRR